MTNKATRILTLTSALFAITLSLEAAPDCDNRVVVASPDYYPFQTVSALRYDADENGFYDSRGSATVVGPHMALTCGHCVFDRDTEAWVTGDIDIVPAMHQDSSGSTVYPHGRRRAKVKRTNTKYTDLSFTSPGHVDYGSLGYVCPFEDITTYMPLVFDYPAGYINMSGYPVTDLPDTTMVRSQWWHHGSVTDLQARRMVYDVRSTGGASGGAVWVYNATDGRRLIAVNRAHSTECNGVGARLVWNNEALIRRWMEWEPTLAAKFSAKCADIEKVPFGELVELYASGALEVLPEEELMVIDPPLESGPAPRRLVFQFIENTFYEWEEFLLEPADPQSPRYVRMVQPEERWLSVFEAQVLLSASRGFEDQQASGDHTTYGPATVEPPLPMPLDDEGPGTSEDGRPDEMIEWSE